MLARIKTAPIRSDERQGFTIVELLIVIVVIGVLAAISIVAYNGIQQKAREATLKSDLASAARLMAADNAQTGSYPLTAASVNNNQGLPSSSGTTYQFHSTGATYCITGTNKTTSFAVSDSATNPTLGGCPGDGVGGIAAVINYVLSPSFEDGTANNGSNISASGGSRTIVTGGTPYGNKFMRATFTDTTSLGWGQTTAIVPVGTYTASFYVRSDIGIKFRPYLQGTATKSTVSSSGDVAVAANSWMRAWTTINVSAAGTIQVGGMFLKDTATPTTSNYIDFDGFMLTPSSSLTNYVDGDSPNWIWNGTPNNSTSAGPAS